MRLAVAVAVAVVTAACGGGESDAAGRLIELGFLDHARPAAREALATELRDDPETGVFSDGTRRFYFADAEALTEGGVGDFLRELEPLLRKLGVPPLRIRDPYEEPPYRVTVNGETYEIWGTAIENSDDLWGYSAARSVRIVNDLLRAAGSRERAYGVTSPHFNDFSVMILTPALRDAVADVVGGVDDDPYAMNLKPPDFGYPGEHAFGDG